MKEKRRVKGGRAIPGKLSFKLAFDLLRDHKNLILPVLNTYFPLFTFSHVAFKDLHLNFMYMYICTPVCVSVAISLGAGVTGDCGQPDTGAGN